MLPVIDRIFGLKDTLFFLDQRVYGYLEKRGEPDQFLGVRLILISFPGRDRLKSHADRIRDLLLGEFSFFTKSSKICSEAHVIHL